MYTYTCTYEHIYIQIYLCLFPQCSQPRQLCDYCAASLSDVLEGVQALTARLNTSEDRHLEVWQMVRADLTKDRQAYIYMCIYKYVCIYICIYIYACLYSFVHLMHPRNNEDKVAFARLVTESQIYIPDFQHKIKTARISFCVNALHCFEQNNIHMIQIFIYIYIHVCM